MHPIKLPCSVVITSSSAEYIIEVMKRHTQALSRLFLQVIPVVQTCYHLELYRDLVVY
jgi:hypothetical protein